MNECILYLHRWWRIMRTWINIQIGISLHVNSEFWVDKWHHKEKIFSDLFKKNWSENNCEVKWFVPPKNRFLSTTRTEKPLEFLFYKELGFLVGRFWEKVWEWVRELHSLTHSFAEERKKRVHSALQFVRVLQYVAVCCSVLECDTVHCNVLQCIAVCCGVLQCDVMCCSVCCSVLQCVAVCCGVLQCDVMCCSVLQCVAVCCSVLQCVAVCCVAVCCRVLQCVAVCCSVLQCVAVCCSVLQCVAVCCSVLQCAAVCCSVL